MRRRRYMIDTQTRIKFGSIWDLYSVVSLSMILMHKLLASMLTFNNIILKTISTMGIRNTFKNGGFFFCLRLTISWWTQDGASSLEVKLNLKIRFFKWKVKNPFVGKAICSSRKLREEHVSLKCLRNPQDNLIKRKISLRFMKIHKSMRVRISSLATAEKKI